MSKEEVLRGLRVKESLTGREIPADAFNVDQRRMVLEYCWAGIWGREGMGLKERSILQLGILAGLHRPNEFRSHVRLALKNGVSVEELRQACIQITAYCGIPTGTEATRIAAEVLAEAGYTFAPVPPDEL